MVNRVFIIDDDDISLYLTQVVLEDAGFSQDIMTYGSAEEAFEALPLTSKEFLPEIIFLDLNMPVKNGWDFLDMLRSHEDEIKDNLAIFILTSSIAASDKALALQYPLVRGFLHKPLSDESIATIKQLYRHTF